MTNPNNGKNEAKTAVDEIVAYIDNDDAVRAVQTLESYADSVAEERVKEAFQSDKLLGGVSAMITNVAVQKAFRAGQENMRERAAKNVENNIDTHWLTLSASIRTLKIEEK